MCSSLVLQAAVPLSLFLLYLSVHFFVIYLATPDIYSLSLHDALPICACFESERLDPTGKAGGLHDLHQLAIEPVDRKSTRLNSSHLGSSYAVFCLIKKQEV